MFRGSHSVSIDSKGRFAIPASYRQTLLDVCGGRMVVTFHHDRCLLVFPQDRFRDFEQQLLRKGSLNSEVRAYQRFYVGNARDCDMDRQGRILLSANLRGFASLDSKAALVGIGNVFELWSEEKWQAQQVQVGDALAAQTQDGELPGALQDVAF